MYYRFQTIVAVAAVVAAALGLVLVAGCAQPTSPPSSAPVADGATDGATDGADDGTTDDAAGDDGDDGAPAEEPPVEESRELRIDFDAGTPGFVAPGYAGTGLACDPDAGALDSDAWQVIGLSDGDVLFGEERSDGDYARGLSPGGASRGGLYAFQVADGDVALGVQPTMSDFAPGSISLKIPVSIADVDALWLEWDLWVYNDEDRSTAWSAAYSADGADWTIIDDLTYSTPVAADESPAWNAITFIANLNVAGRNLTTGDSLFVRWTAEDGEGSGGRDEAALDNILVRMEDIAQ